MRYLIIGLGIYGTSLAKDLTDMGHEVIGADTNATKVDAIKDYISTAYILDATDEAAINVLPLKNVDMVIVTIGENFGASVKAVALLCKIGVKNIYARAIDNIHEAILQGLNVKRILMPEQRAAHDLVNELAFGTEVESIRIDRDRFVIRFPVPDIYEGMNYRALTTEALYGLRLVGASRHKPNTNLLGMNTRELVALEISMPDEDDSSHNKDTTGMNPVVEKGDIITCIGSGKDVSAMLKHVR